MKLTLNLFNLLLVCIIFGIMACSDDDGNTNLAPEVADRVFSLVQGSQEGTVVGVVVATDADQDPLTFSITDGNSNDAFAINASSGQITVNASSALDAETDNTFVLTVEVNDGQQGVLATITIHLVESVPNIEDQNFSIDENSESGTIIGTVVANDPVQNPLTFSITAGNNGDAFAISASSGEITVNAASALDFETNASFSLTVTVSNGKQDASATIAIALNNIEPEPFTTRQQIIDALNASYVQLESYIEFAYLFDAVYSNTINAPTTDWDDVFFHSLNSKNDQVLRLWSDAYAIWFVLNNVRNSAEQVLSTGQERDEIIAQALAIRAYLQWNLVTWFRNVPLETGIVAGNIPQSEPSDVLDQVKADLGIAINGLPVSWTGEDVGRFTKGTAEALLCRVYLETQEWQQALTLSQGVLDNGTYSLSPDINDFTASDTEIIWGFDQTGETVFSGAYDRGAHVPLVRLTETYLINAESNMMSGFNDQGRARLNELKQRSSQTPIADGVNGFSELIARSFEQWVFEMAQGGVSFATLKRFGKALDELSIEGFRLLLPIPWEVLDSDSDQKLFQNAGY